MKLFSIIFVFGLLQHWGSGGPIQQDSWFDSLLKKLSVNTTVKKFAWWLMPVLLVLLPALLVQLLMISVSGMLFGVVELVITCAVLLYSLGRNQFDLLIEKYLRSWNNEDIEGACLHAQEFSCLMPLCEDGGEDIDLASLHQHAATAIVYQGFERWFAVIFWFVILGPAGAVAYRLGFLYSRHPIIKSEAIDIKFVKLMHCLEWLPAQLLGLSFALAGNFASCFSLWRKRLTTVSRSVCEMLMHYAIAALGVNEALACQGDCTEEDRAQVIAQGNDQILALQQLLHRCVVLWVIFLSVFILLV